MLNTGINWPVCSSFICVIGLWPFYIRWRIQVFSGLILWWIINHIIPTHCTYIRCQPSQKHEISSIQYFIRIIRNFSVTFNDNLLNSAHYESSMNHIISSTRRVSSLFHTSSMKHPLEEQQHPQCSRKPKSSIYRSRMSVSRWIPLILDWT